MGNALCSLSCRHHEDVFTFDEEPNLLGVAQGFGYCPIVLGQTFHEARYEVIRKLGWGSSSVVYLARDQELKRFVALKVLSAYQTSITSEGLVAEREIMEKITSANTTHRGYQHVTHLLHYFTADSKNGRHSIFSTDVLGSDLQSLRQAQPSRRFSLAITKRIIQQVLVALDYIHIECGVVHTDLKPDNMMVDLDHQETAIRKLLSDDPSRVYPTRSASSDPILTIVSQPLPDFGLQADCSNLKIKLSDFGESTWKDKHRPGQDISHVGLRAPEVVLGLPWSTPVDIWALGCLVFEFMTAASLFTPTAGPTYTEEHNLVAKYIMNTGQSFPTSMLRKSKRAAMYFDRKLYEADGVDSINKVRGIGFQIGTLDQALKNYEICTEEEIKDTSRFMRRCLTFDPTERATAAELLEDDWLK
ncbi:hypothetical protein FRB94_009865 [Tulasnella sp. JGI-2019a]|nr:hypothetical protein FRB93_013747 [Tulasnella sp. JGI-2019a]KAG9010784.1 hypothetical protein FRB94_009865 [Tulasnella sp. JGI-2019a]